MNFRVFLMKICRGLTGRNTSMTAMMKSMTIYFSIFWKMPCFFKEITHLYCPACGGTRAVRALLHLDLTRSFLCNPIVLYGVVMVLWCLGGFLAGKILHRTIQICRPGLWMLYLGIILFFGHAVIRNIAVYQFGYDYLGDLLR